MRMFAASYTFTCPACLQWNARRIEVSARDVVDARDRVVSDMSCGECGASLPAGHSVGTDIHELRQ